MPNDYSWASIRADGFEQIALEKLMSSGLTADDAIACGIEYLTPELTSALGYQNRPSMKLNYFDPNTGGYLIPSPGDAPFYRLRYLGKPQGFSAQAAKERRYVQPPGTGVCAYFPAIIKDWPDILTDPTRPLYITEGELKAIAACKLGFPTIGLGGVYSWRSGPSGVWLLPELENIAWLKRLLYLIFDSDFRSNPNVCQATNALAQRVAGEGAKPHFIPLPEAADGAKTGLDDFLARERHPVNRLNALIRDEAEPISIAAPLWALNEELLYVRDPGVFLGRSTEQMMDKKTLDSRFENRTGTERKVTSDGVEYKEVPLAPLWLKWKYRAEVEGLTFSPGENRLIYDDEIGGVVWNTWKGWGVELIKGDVSPFTDLVHHLFTGADPGDMHWFLQWLAYPLQHPGTKLQTYTAIIGNQGTGKSLVARTLGYIYGKQFSEINQEEFDSPFNGFMANCQFLLVDDYSGTDKRQVADKFKTLITRKYVWINIKFVRQYKLPDHMNIYVTSNQTDCLFLEDKDRRAFVHRVTADPLPDAWYQAYLKALAKDLPSAVFDYLLHYDLTGFDPGAKARVNQTKLTMTELVKSDLEAWIARLRDDPDHVLCVGKAPMSGDLYEAKALCTLFQSTTPDNRITPQGLSRKLSQAGFIQTQQLRTPWGLQRVWIVRNREKWEKASNAEIIKHLQSFISELPGGAL